MLGTALGLFLSAFAATEFQAVQFLPAFVLPQFLLCGLLVPRDQLPDVAALRCRTCCRSRTPSTRCGRSRPTPPAPPSVLRDVAIVLAFAVAALAGGAATLRRRTP